MVLLGQTQEKDWLDWDRMSKWLNWDRKEKWTSFTGIQLEKLGDNSGMSYLERGEKDWAYWERECKLTIFSRKDLLG